MIKLTEEQLIRYVEAWTNAMFINQPRVTVDTSLEMLK